MEKFPSEVDLYDQSYRTLWNPILNNGYVEKDQEKRVSGVEMCSFTLKLLMEHMRTDE